ncbi:MAG: ATP-binding protein [Candidatus Omnitrophica bacterium]|jgi:serine/threonine-protein kinase RsbW|nr:ATP-binding protein [Candidatus Omnitrophota bacterium]
MVIKYQINSDLKNILPVALEIFQKLKSEGVKEDVLFDVRLCLEEAAINAIKHGNKKNKKKLVYITVKFSGRSIEMIVKDEGKGFDHKNIPSPTKGKNIKKLSGRGIFLIRKLMDSVKFSDGGNKIKMVKLF